MYFKDYKIINLGKILDISKLEDDWNGYGAKKISNKVINLALCIVQKLSYQPSNIYPVATNSIQFEYELDDKSYLEFDIFEDKVSLLFVRGSDRYLPYDKLKLMAVNKYLSICDTIIIEMNLIIKLFVNKQFNELVKILNRIK